MLDETPAAGDGANNLTAFNPPQYQWRFKGHQGWHYSQDEVMYAFERRDHRDPSYQPGPLRFNGYVILNNNSE